MQDPLLDPVASITPPRGDTTMEELDAFDVGEGLPSGELDVLNDLFAGDPAMPEMKRKHSLHDAVEPPAATRQHSLQDMTREDSDVSGEASAAAAPGPSDEVAEAVAEVSRFSREPTLAAACVVLRSIHAGDALGLEVKPSASPVKDAGSQIYVMNRKLKKGRGGPGGGFAVTFQSAHNSEIFFAEGADYGVAARPMGRTTKRAGATEPHGYRGKLYTLVRRAKPGSARSVELVDDALGLVRVWRVADEETDSLSSLGSAYPPPAKTRKRGRGASGADHVAGGLTVGGDLVVNGYIHGRLVTPEGAADYAEWLPRKAGEEPAPPGTVVRVEGRGSWTRDTRGPGPCLVVSTSPSLAAGVPAVDADKGALIAFMGQVPVRCVGPVAVGDRLFPSGRGDGLAVAQRHAAAQAQEVGVAMASSPGDGAAEHVVPAFVRWQAAVQKEVADREGFYALRAYRGALTALAIAAVVVALVALCFHIDLLSHMKLPKGFSRAALFFLDLLQTGLVVALVASFQENVPCRLLLAAIAIAGFIVACFGMAAGISHRDLKNQLILAWCVISFIFHATTLGVAGIILAGNVMAPKVAEMLDYDALDDDDEAAQRLARRRRVADVVAGVAVILTFLWFVLGPPCLAVAVVNHHLSNRIDRLEDDMDD
mmetsp:Transcript_21897/g.65609  ORF Transcript_21897/g.65609 Transcript_21897/m.65609 type:complete len:654 (+) Transcript_21897:316-2277(+)